jgi:hypothetical protein
MDKLINDIKIDVESRPPSKYDAYLDLSESLTMDEIKEIIKKVSGTEINKNIVEARLFAPRKLQVYWVKPPRTCPFERMLDIGPITDPDTFMKYWKQFYSKNKETLFDKLVN